MSGLTGYRPARRRATREQSEMLHDIVLGLALALIAGALLFVLPKVLLDGDVKLRLTGLRWDGDGAGRRAQEKPATGDQR